MKKQQDHILWTFESKNINHEQVDISDPRRDKERELLREKASPEPPRKVCLPPQIFNDDDYIGVRK